MPNVVFPDYLSEIISLKLSLRRKLKGWINQKLSFYS
jgi:hypothetical protein